MEKVIEEAVCPKCHRWCRSIGMGQFVCACMVFRKKEAAGMRTYEEGKGESLHGQNVHKVGA